MQTTDFAGKSPFRERQHDRATHATETDAGSLADLHGYHERQHSLALGDPDGPEASRFFEIVSH